MADFSDPRFESLLPNLGKAIQSFRHFQKVRTHPRNHIKDELMLGIQIPPVNDPLVVKDTVTEDPNHFQIRLPLFAFVQAFGKTGKDSFESTR
jgi:hypothetical protein